MGPARAFALVVTGVAVSLGCGGAPVVVTDPARERYERLMEQARPLLTPTERNVLAAIEGDAERTHYLAEIGVAAELAFRERLRPGLEMGEVEASLGAPEDRETEWVGGASLEYWTYRGAPPAQAGDPPPPVPAAIEVKSVLQFRDGRLLTWTVERRQE